MKQIIDTEPLRIIGWFSVCTTASLMCYCVFHFMFQADNIRFSFALSSVSFLLCSRLINWNFESFFNIKKVESTQEVHGGKYVTVGARNCSGENAEVLIKTLGNDTVINEYFSFKNYVKITRNLIRTTKTNQLKVIFLSFFILPFLLLIDNTNKNILSIENLVALLPAIFDLINTLSLYIYIKGLQDFKID